jgi:hypothetical protein
MKKIYKLLTMVLIAFAGGFFAFVFINWLYKPVTITSASDAISIANTFIVFTTIIFVGFTVVLGIAGYVFTQQFSASKEAHEDRVIDDLKTRLKDDEGLNIELIKAILENEAVKAHLTTTLESKVNQLVTDKVTELELTVGAEFKDMANNLTIDGGNAIE